MPHGPSTICTRGLPGRSRPCSSHLGTFSCPQLPTFSVGTLRTIYLASTIASTKPAVFMPMIRPFSNPFYGEKCLLTRLPGILCFLESTYNRPEIFTFINLPLNAALYDVLFLIAAPLGHAHSHQNWIICISQILLLICKVSRLYFFPSWGAIFNVPEYT